MYIPKQVAEDNIPALHEFIRKYPFATLITHTSSGLNADHIPLYLNTTDSQRICLQGHIATPNPLWQSVTNNSEVLVVFQGINSYITPSWLPSKKIHGKVVPTWNYTAVHAKGTIAFIHTPEWKMDLLHNLTLAQEQKLAQPWSVADAPAEFIEKLLPAIVGLEIVVSEIIGKFKLSQNQSAENRIAIADALHTEGHEMAGLITQL